MVRPMVHSTKHYVQHSINTIAGSAQVNLVIVDAVNVASKTGAGQVEEGSSVKACFIECWLRAGDTVGASYVAALYKLPGTGVAFTTTQMAAMFDAENKKNILWFGMGLVNDQDADATAIMRQWYKIPKSKQRFGLGDRLILSIFAQGAIDMHHCGFETFKEYM